MDRPNILVIMTDQQRATASTLYRAAGCPTPSLARLAERGVLFDRAFTPHPLCVPARVSLWTAQYPHTHGARRNEILMPRGAVHAFGIWREEGYRTALIGKNHCFTAEDRDSLFDVWCEIGHQGLARTFPVKGMEWWRPAADIEAAHGARRNERYRNPVFDYSISDHPTDDYSSGLIAGQTVRFLEEHGGEPFALWVSFPDPHEPWDAPAGYAAMFPPDSIELPPWREDEFADARWPERNRVLSRMLGVREAGEAEVRSLIATYYAMVRFIDDSVGRIMSALDGLGLRESTIVVFCSDHGDFMGEHAMQCKGGVFYDCLTRVPLIVSWPGVIPSGTHDRSLVNLVDIVPTLLSLQGLAVPGCMQGAPLPTVTGTPPREAAFSEYGAGGPPFTTADLEALPRPHGRKTLIRSLRWREAEGLRKMVRTADWKYVHDPLGDIDELYDLANDPWELDNLATETGYGDVLSDMRRRLMDWSITTETAVPLPEAEWYGG